MTAPKLCLACRYCYLDRGFGGSDVTPPDGTSFTCQKGHWRGSWENKQDLQSNLLLADSCPDFTPEPP